LFLIACSFFLRASEPIPAPKEGNSVAITQPHVTAELIPDYNSINSDKLDVALHLHMDPGWHTYWINPGDGGLATTIDWTLPPGFTAGPIQWPTPERHNMGPLVIYGYEGDVYLLTTITLPHERLRWPIDVKIKAHATWLACQETCIPGKADLSFRLEGGVSKPARAEDAFRAKFFTEARARLPVPNTRWEVTATYGPVSGVPDSKAKEALWIQFADKTIVPNPIIPSEDIYFFPEQGNVLSPEETGDFGTLHQKVSAFWWIIALQQNGEKPSRLSGVLVYDQSIIEKSRAVYISAFPTDDTSVLTSHALNYKSEESDSSQPPAPPLGTAAATLQTGTSDQPWLIAVLGAAFVGGLILNLMPCVLPVLSLKVFSLIRHAGENRRAAWIQGVAFTVGVVISFWVLAGLLLALRAAGNQIGWGFQMQSSGFVLTLIFIFFLLALNLLGVFELGTSLVGVDAKATSKTSGLASSFLNGALATVAATPCTAPFMGSSLGFAAQQPPFVAMLIFTFLAFGMATPYLLLTIFPGALRFVPKPGAWMETLKQFMGFLLIATVIFLVYVFGALVGQDQIPWLLVTLLLAGIAAWVYGRWGTPARSLRVRVAALIVTLGLLVYALNWGITLAQVTPPETTIASNSNRPGDLNWQPWSPATVEQALTQGHPVFIDFTAAWCVSCKVNEQVALENNAVKKAFAEKNIVLFRADWTHADPEISKTLRQFNRDGVPLYLLYSPKNKDAPQVLPEVLTPGIVLEALQKL